MATQLVHETEVHRQHVRLKIPITVEVDGARFACDDWSMGGFGIEGGPAAAQPGERLSVRLIFPFEDFEIALRAECQVVYVTEDGTRAGYKFVGLSGAQIELFRYLVDAYLSGELVTAGDVLSVAGRENSADARALPLNFNPYAEEATLGRRIRRILGLVLLGLAGVGLAGLIWLGVQDRWLTVKAATAVIEAPTYRLRAPASGVVEAATDKTFLKPGDPVAAVRAGETQRSPIPSPCDCVVLEWLVPAGQYAQAGETVAVLVAADQPLLVRAQVDFDRALGLEADGAARILVPGRGDPMPGRIQRSDFKPQLTRGEPPGPTDRRLVQVIVRPERPFDFEDLGALVDVRFP